MTKKTFFHSLIGCLLIASGTIVTTGCQSSSTGEATTNDADIEAALSSEEATEGFFLLFDGKSSLGWRGYGLDSFPSEGWIIENGELRVQASGQGESGGKGGDIIFDRKFKDFHLKLEWKVAPGANSGILYLASENPGEPIWHSGLEMQVLCNEDKKYEEIKDAQRAGALYDLVAANPVNVNSTGEWNLAEIIVRDSTIVHRLNGITILETKIGTPAWYELVKNSKFSEMPSFGKYQPGFIGLQDHGDEVRYRNIRIKEFAE
jgi:hypothetical protein